MQPSGPSRNLLAEKMNHRVRPVGRLLAMLACALLSSMRADMASTIDEVQRPGVMLVAPAEAAPVSRVMAAAKAACSTTCPNETELKLLAAFIDNRLVGASVLTRSGQALYAGAWLYAWKRLGLLVTRLQPRGSCSPCADATSLWERTLGRGEVDKSLLARLLDERQRRSQQFDLDESFKSFVADEDLSSGVEWAPQLQEKLIAGKRGAPEPTQALLRTLDGTADDMAEFTPPQFANASTLWSMVYSMIDQSLATQPVPGGGSEDALRLERSAVWLDWLQKRLDRDQTVSKAHVQWLQRISSYLSFRSQWQGFAARKTKRADLVPRQLRDALMSVEGAPLPAAVAWHRYLYLAAWEQWPWLFNSSPPANQPCDEHAWPVAEALKKDFPGVDWDGRAPSVASAHAISRRTLDRGAADADTAFFVAARTWQANLMYRCNLRAILSLSQSTGFGGDRARSEQLPRKVLATARTEACRGLNAICGTAPCRPVPGMPSDLCADTTPPRAGGSLPASSRLSDAAALADVSRYGAQLHDLYVAAKTAEAELKRGHLSTASILASGGTLRRLDLTVPPRLPMREYAARILRTAGETADEQTRSSDFTKMAEAVCHAGRELHVRAFDERVRKAMAETAKKARDVGKRLLEVAELDQELSAIELQIADFQNQAAQHALAAATGAADLSRQAVAVEARRVEVFESAATQALDLVSDFEKKAQDLAKELKKLSQEAEAEQQRQELFGFLDFAITVVGAVAAPFTGGLSLQIATGAKAALRAVKDATKPGAWDDLNSGIATLTGIVENLQTAFPDLSKKLTDKVAQLGAGFHMGDLLTGLRAQGPIGNVMKAFLEGRVVNVDHGQVKFNEAAFEKLVLPPALEGPLAKITKAGASFRSVFFDMWQDPADIAKWTAEEMGNRFADAVLKEGLGATQLAQVQDAISEIKKAAPAQLAALRNLMGTPVVVAQVENGNMVTLRRKAEAFFDEAIDDFGPELTAEAEHALEEVAKRLDERRKAWIDMRDSVAQDPVALRALAAKVLEECKSGAALEDLKKLKAQLGEAKRQLATRKRELNNALETQHAAEFALKASERRVDAANRKVARENLQRSAAEGNADVLADKYHLAEERQLFASGMTQLALYDFDKAIADFRATLAASGILMDSKDVDSIVNSWVQTGDTVSHSIVDRVKSCEAVCTAILKRQPINAVQQRAAARREVVADALAGISRWLLLMDGVNGSQRNAAALNLLFERLQTFDIDDDDKDMKKTKAILGSDESVDCGVRRSNFDAIWPAWSTLICQTNVSEGPLGRVDAKNVLSLPTGRATVQFEFCPDRPSSENCIHVQEPAYWVVDKALLYAECSRRASLYPAGRIQAVYQGGSLEMRQLVEGRPHVIPRSAYCINDKACPVARAQSEKLASELAFSTSGLDIMPAVGRWEVRVDFSKDTAAYAKGQKCDIILYFPIIQRTSASSGLPSGN